MSPNRSAVRRDEDSIEPELPKVQVNKQNLWISLKFRLPESSTWRGSCRVSRVATQWSPRCAGGLSQSGESPGRYGLLRKFLRLHRATSIFRNLPALALLLLSLRQSTQCAVQGFDNFRPPVQRVRRQGVSSMRMYAARQRPHDLQGLLGLHRTPWQKVSQMGAFPAVTNEHDRQWNFTGSFCIAYTELLENRVGPV